MTEETLESNEYTDEEIREQDTEKLITALLAARHMQNPGLDFLQLNSNSVLVHLGISNPWDLFDFCRKHGLWVQVRNQYDGKYYYAIKVKEVKHIIVE